LRKLFFLIVLLIAAFVWGDDVSLFDSIENLNLLSGKKNIVVMGCDVRKDDVGRSDTLFVVMLDKSKKNAALLSVPRDTRIKIKGHGWDKINAAFAYGGHKLTQETVQDFLGIKLNNYVVVDFQGFKGLVDAVGGVDINVEKRMYYYDTYSGFEIDLKPGKQHLDGKTAMQYVRYRDEEGDIGRIRRQQKFMMALYQQIASKNIIAKVPGVTKQIMSMIKTDLSLKEMVELGNVMRDMMEKDGLKMSVVPGEPKYIDGISYWIPDIPKMRQQMAEMQGVKITEKFNENTKKLEQEYKSPPKK
jgi:cell envelope-related function transcriptional attenuator common domain